MFLLPGLVIGSYVTGMPFKDEEKREMIRYLLNRADPVDGGWGMYVLFRISFIHDAEASTAMLKDIPLSLELLSTIV